MIGKKLSNEEFKSICSLKHSSFYNYDKTNYINDKTKVLITCPVHGDFWQYPSNHKIGNGCDLCARRKRGMSKRFSLNKLKEKFFEIHQEAYNYDLITEQVTHKQKIKIQCNKCKLIFETTVDHHLNQRCGCPQCIKSKGEIRIINFLNKNKINFIPQKKFDDCRGKRNPLPFDFYLIGYNLCIEFDGIQHFKGWSGDKKDLESHKIRDLIKTNYCLVKNIRLIRISYLNFDSIEEILKEELLTNIE